MVGGFGKSLFVSENREKHSVSSQMSHPLAAHQLLAALLDLGCDRNLGVAPVCSGGGGGGGGAAVQAACQRCMGLIQCVSII